MGSSWFICTPKGETSLDHIESIEPETWTQSEVYQWLKYSNNGNFKSLIQPFKKNKISGLSFVHLTNDDLKYKLGIKQIGLRDSFIVSRDKLILKYNTKQQQLQIVISTTSFNKKDATKLGIINTSNEYYAIQSHSQLTPISASPISASLDSNIDSFIIKKHKQIDNAQLQTAAVRLESYSYFDLCHIIINGFCRKYISISNIMEFDMINVLCLDFYCEYTEHYMRTFSYDLWKTLGTIEIKTFLRSDCSNIIRGFTGYDLIKHIKQHMTVSNDNNIKHLGKSLVRYNYIRLVAMVSGNRLNVQMIDGNAYRNDFKHAHNSNDNVYLYQFESEKHGKFIKYDEPDRLAWYKGCSVDIYSETLGGWNIGKIIDIENDLITVEYKDNINGSLMMKSVDRYQNNMIRSSKQFLYNRKNWKLNCELMIYSNSSGKWYKGKVIEVILRNNNIDIPFDILQIYYKNDNGKEFKKYINRWSVDLRIINIGNNRNKYKINMIIMVWSNSKQIWMKGKIINIKNQYKPPYTLIHVTYGKHYDFEKILPSNSNDLRLYDTNTIGLQLLESYKRKPNI